MELAGPWIGDGKRYYPWRKVNWMKTCECHGTNWCVYVGMSGYPPLEFIFKDEQTARNSLEYLMRHSHTK